jgi:hypothetical protein
MCWFVNEEERGVTEVDWTMTTSTKIRMNADMIPSTVNI